MQLRPEERTLESSLATSAAQTPCTSTGRRRHQGVNTSASFLVAGLLSVTRNVTKDAQSWVFGRKQAAGRAVTRPLPRAEQRWDPVPSPGTAAHLLLHLQHSEMETHLQKCLEEKPQPLPGNLLAPSQRNSPHFI